MDIIFSGSIPNLKLQKPRKIWILCLHKSFSIQQFLQGKKLNKQANKNSFSFSMDLIWKQMKQWWFYLLPSYGKLATPPVSLNPWEPNTHFVSPVHTFTLTCTHRNIYFICLLVVPFNEISCSVLFIYFLYSSFSVGKMKKEKRKNTTCKTILKCCLPWI